MLNNQLPVSSRPGSVAFPCQGEEWTEAQRDAIWGGDIAGMLRGLLRDAAADPGFLARLAAQHEPALDANNE